MFRKVSSPSFCKKPYLINNEFMDTYEDHAAGASYFSAMHANLSHLKKMLWTMHHRNDLPLLCEEKTAKCIWKSAIPITNK